MLSQVNIFSIFLLLSLIAFPILPEKIKGIEWTTKRREGPNGQYVVINERSNPYYFGSKISTSIDIESILWYDLRFTDMEYPPIPKSLVGKAANSNFDDASKLVWKRISEVYRRDIEDLEVLGDDISPSDVQPGIYVSDHPLYTVLQSLATAPKLLEVLFMPRKSKYSGAYCVRFFIDGLFREVVVDDYVPFRDKKHAFLGLQNNNTWPLVLEKAWTKVIGSYGALLRKYSLRDMLVQLTGYPVLTILHSTINRIKEKNRFFDKTLKEEDFQVLVCTASGSKITINSMESRISNYIQLGQNYAVTKVFEMETRPDHSKKYIEVTNYKGALNLTLDDYLYVFESTTKAVIRKSFQKFTFFSYNWSDAIMFNVNYTDNSISTKPSFVLLSQPNPFLLEQYRERNNYNKMNSNRYARILEFLVDNSQGKLSLLMNKSCNVGSSSAEYKHIISKEMIIGESGQYGLFGLGNWTYLKAGISLSFYFSEGIEVDAQPPPSQGWVISSLLLVLEEQRLNDASPVLLKEENGCKITIIDIFETFAGLIFTNIHNHTRLLLKLTTDPQNNNIKILSPSTMDSEIASEIASKEHQSFLLVSEDKKTNILNNLEYSINHVPNFCFGPDHKRKLVNIEPGFDLEVCRFASSHKKLSVYIVNNSAFKFHGYYFLQRKNDKFPSTVLTLKPKGGFSVKEEKINYKNKEDYSIQLEKDMCHH